MYLSFNKIINVERHDEVNLDYVPTLLTHYCLNSFFRRPKIGLFVYRLVVATLIGNFFDDPFLN